MTTIDRTTVATFDRATARRAGTALALASGLAIAGFTALGSAFVFHVDAGTYDAVALSSPRTQHGAGQVDGGNTLLVGGLSASGARVDTLEWFQPESGLTHVLG